MEKAIKMEVGFVYKLNDGSVFEMDYSKDSFRQGRLHKEGVSYHTSPGTSLYAVEVLKDNRVSLYKKYVTKSGLPVRVLALDVAGERPVAATIGEPGKERVIGYLTSGVRYSSFSDEDDLVEVVPGTYHLDEVVEVESVGYWLTYHYREPLDERNHTVWSNGRSSATVRDDKSFLVVPSDRIRKLA